MLFKVVIAAWLVAVGASGSAVAQGRGAIDGPAENPPTSYSGKQFVDSKGCVYIRTGYGGDIIWAPRLTSERKALCGYRPTISRTRNATIPAAVIVASAGAAAVQSSRQSPAIAPKGFKTAWHDGRLNNIRGPRTAAGDAQMAAVWTNTLPRRLVGANAVSSAVSSKIIPVKMGAGQVGSGNYYIQLTAIEDLQNIKANFRWLRTVGLPGGLMKSNRSGKEIQLVLAGPFNVQADLERAMTMVQGAGYAGVIIQK